MPIKYNLVGQKFGSLYVKEFLGTRYTKGGAPYRAYLCVCDCGNTTIVPTINLTSGHSTRCKKCGIMESSKKRIKHGDRNNSRLYSIWSSMYSRCYIHSASAYDNYGGRGIRICDEWTGENGYLNFKKWSYENGYSESLTAKECSIDRIDPNKDYTPSNCRWVNFDVQANNKRNCHYIVDGKETLTLSQLARKYNLSVKCVFSRWYRGKRTLQELTAPLQR